MQDEMTLMEISDALVSVIETGYKFDEETGEIFWDSGDIDALEESLQKKAEACAVVLKGKTALVKGIDEEIKALQARKKSIESQAKSFKEYISICVDVCGGEIETPKVKLSFRKSSSVEIVDDEAVPEEYLRVKKVVTVDKNAVKEAITKQGENVPGCVLVEKKNLQVK